MNGPGDLTEEEWDFAMDGAFEAAFAGTNPGGQALLGARQLLAALNDRFPERTKRMLFFATLAKEALEERDRLLDEVLRSNMHWSHGEKGWGGIAWQPYQLYWLAECTGLSLQTVKARHKKLLRITLADAMEAAGEDATEVRALI